jgi:hypothetical protein
MGRELRLPEPSRVESRDKQEEKYKKITDENEKRERETGKEAISLLLLSKFC